MPDSPLRVVRPAVVPAQFIARLPLVAFLSLSPGFFAFVISNMLIREFGDPALGYGVAAYLLALLAGGAYLAAKTFWEPGLTSYAVYADRVEYAEGLWNRQRRTVVFDRVIDVELTEAHSHSRAWARPKRAGRSGTATERGGRMGPGRAGDEGNATRGRSAPAARSLCIRYQ